MTSVGIIAIAAIAAVAVGDAAVAAAVAGVFSIINTFIGARILRRQSQTERHLAAPRRAVYDSDGRLVGTVLKLENEWEQPRRRLTDHGPIEEP